LASVLAARHEPLIYAMTLMVAVIGGSTDTQLGLFATPETIAAAKLETTRRGVLEGREMGRVFAWMRPNDLIWNYWINNYLMGNDPPLSTSFIGITIPPAYPRSFTALCSTSLPTTGCCSPAS